MKVSWQYLQTLRNLSPSAVTGEYYLTDLVTPATPFVAHNACKQSLQGINTPKELRQAVDIFRMQQFHTLFQKGVFCDDSDSVMLCPGAEIGQGTRLARNISIIGRSRIGQNCTIGQGAIIKNSNIGDCVSILPYSIIDGCDIGAHAQAGPFCHIQQTQVKAHAVIGNFVEIKRSTIGEHVKAKHLSYLGDSYVDNYANIGAGVITCNYTPWHRKKSHTYIGKNALVGAGSLLVAPSVIGDYSVCAAGSVLTHMLPPFSLGISRPKLSIKPNWAYTKLSYAADAAENS